MTNTKQEAEKQAAALAALPYVPDEAVVGVGTGSTVNYFIAALADIRHRIEGAVASSEATALLLKQYHIPVLDLNAVGTVPVYVDGADEINPALQCIKGGGGALTREKILASCADKFICIADSRKQVRVLGQFPLAVEVIPMARSYVGREVLKLGGDPVYRAGFKTDNGNIIIDVHNWVMEDPLALEAELNQITGVVCHGLFAKRSADLLLVGTEAGVVSVNNARQAD